MCGVRKGEEEEEEEGEEGKREGEGKGWEVSVEREEVVGGWWVTACVCAYRGREREGERRGGWVGGRVGGGGGAGCRVQGAGCRVQGAGCWVQEEEGVVVVVRGGSDDSRHALHAEMNSVGQPPLGSHCWAAAPASTCPEQSEQRARETQDRTPPRRWHPTWSGRMPSPLLQAQRKGHPQATRSANQPTDLGHAIDKDANLTTDLHLHLEINHERSTPSTWHCQHSPTNRRSLKPTMKKCPSTLVKSCLWNMK